MADYFTLLSRAVASLDHNTRDAREALYNRARTVLFDQLRAANPPWSDAQIKTEAASLEAAIRQVESDISRSGGRPRAAANPATPSRRPIDTAENADEDTEQAAPTAQTVQTALRSLSPTLIGVIGAVILAIVAAGGYAYLSRPGAKSSTTAVRTAGDAGSKPNGRQQPAGRKTTGKDQKGADTTNSVLPYVLRRQFVYYRSTYPPGTIVIVKSQHMLYQVRAETVALRYSIAIGPKCLDSAGLHRVVRKDGSSASPSAAVGSPPPATPASVSNGSPGAPVLYLNDLENGIHGTDKTSVIGQNSSFGCFLLAGDDITDLYERTPLDTRVVITN